jgi:hypothetical protein
MGLRDRRRHRRPKERNDTGENPVRNGLSEVGAGICGFVGLDGGGCSQMRTRLQSKFPLIRENKREFIQFRPIARCRRRKVQCGLSRLRPNSLCRLIG